MFCLTPANTNGYLHKHKRLSKQTQTNTCTYLFLMDEIVVDGLCPSQLDRSQLFAVLVRVRHGDLCFSCFQLPSCFPREIIRFSFFGSCRPHGEPPWTSQKLVTTTILYCYLTLKTHTADPASCTWVSTFTSPPWSGQRPLVSFPRGLHCPIGRSTGNKTVATLPHVICRCCRHLVPSIKLYSVHYERPWGLLENSGTSSRVRARNLNRFRAGCVFQSTVDRCVRKLDIQDFDPIHILRKILSSLCTLVISYWLLVSIPEIIIIDCFTCCDHVT